MLKRGHVSCRVDQAHPLALRILVRGEERFEPELLQRHVLRSTERHDRAEQAELETVLPDMNRQQQIRRAKEKRVDARNHPRGAKLEKGTGTLQGIDVQPASVDVIRAVATGEVPIVTGAEDEEDYTPVVIRTKRFDPEWMTVEDAVDRMELVGHDFFLFIDARTDQPSVVYRRKGWDYGVISLTTTAAPAELVS